MTELSNHLIYYYYDEPQIIGSEDSFGVKYISVLVSSEAEKSLYVVLRPVRDLLIQFLLGKASLLDLYNDSNTEFGFIDGVFDPAENIQFSHINRSDVLEEWYPGPRFKLLPAASESMAVDARLKNLVLFNLGLEASESENELRVSVDSLVDALSQFSKLRHKAWGALKKVGKLSKDTVLPVTDVVGFAPGSFKVNLQSREMPDLTGKTVTEDVLTLITDILSDVEHRNVDDLKLKIMSYKSPEIFSSLVEISDFISKKGCPIYIEWATPRRGMIKKVISRDSAAFILNNLGYEEKINSYYEELTGVFISANVQTGQWSLSLGKGLMVTGKTAKTLGKNALKGVVLAEKTYKLNCKFEIYFDLKKNEEVQKVELVELTSLD